MQDIQKFAIDEHSRKQLDQLFTLVECQLGFPIFHEIEKSKIQMSKNTGTTHHFKFDYLGLTINQEISPKVYQEKMLPIVEEIMNNMMNVFAQAKLSTRDVDQICLTGGSAQFPMIREKLKALFGEERLVEHNIFQSVVGGLGQFGVNLLKNQ